MQSEPKQVIVIRKDLNMRKGKMAAQAAHASMKVLLDQATLLPGENFLRIPLFGENSAVRQWLIHGRFKKVCVSVDSEQELMEVYSKAIQHMVMTSLVVDSGLTEFNGVPTKTCIAVGPDYPENIDPITGHLKLL